MKKTGAEAAKEGIKRRFGSKATSSGGWGSDAGRASTSSGQPLPRKMMQRLRISPTTVLIITLGYMGGEVLLHIFSKITGN